MKTRWSSVCYGVTTISLLTTQFIAGSLFVLVIAIVLALNSPVYLIRAAVIRLAKYLRPDLGKPLDPLSVGFAWDLYSSSKPPRSNTIATLIFHGRIELSQFKDFVLERWIHAKTGRVLKYPQLSQFPVTWLGFLFWKSDTEFDIDNHIFLRHNDGHGLTENQLTKHIEDLLNARHHPSRSPWEIHIFHNYLNLKLHPGEMSVVAIKYHHGLSDGHGVFHAVEHDLFGKDYHGLPKKVIRPKSYSWNRLANNILISPYKGLSELTQLLWEMQRDNPLKIQDEQKAWHQIFARSKLIPMSQIKEIKNRFGVTFTAVLFSAVSAGIHKYFEGRRGSRIQSIQCLLPLPLPFKSRPDRLANHLTGTLVHMPSGGFEDPVDRLLECNNVLMAAQNSTIPALATSLIACSGSHFRWLLPFMMNRVTIGVGLSNFPCFEEGFIGSVLGKRLLFAEPASGCHQGTAGIGVMVVSSLGHTRLAVTAEKAIFSRNELAALVTSVEEEIANLLSRCDSN